MHPEHRLSTPKAARNDGSGGPLAGARGAVSEQIHAEYVRLRGIAGPSAAGVRQNDLRRAETTPRRLAAELASFMWQTVSHL
jgi:hypothetical protein